MFTRGGRGDNGPDDGRKHCLGGLSVSGLVVGVLQILGAHKRKPNVNRYGWVSLWRALTVATPSRLQLRSPYQAITAVPAPSTVRVGSPLGSSDQGGDSDGGDGDGDGYDDGDDDGGGAMGGGPPSPSPFQSV